MSSSDSRHRLGLVAITGLSLFGALFARLWFLQVVDRADLEAKVASNVQKTVIVPAPRGRILDRNGVVLVDNRQSIVVAVDTQAYDDLDDTERARVTEHLITTLNRRRTPDQAITEKFVETRLQDARFSRLRPIPIVDDVSVDEEIYFREQAERFPSVVVERQTVRSYPYGSLAAHVLGYVGALSEGQYADLKELGGSKPYERSDEIGKSGVEREYEKYLRGTPGRRVYEVGPAGERVREITSKRREPVAGDDLYLSIDAKVQYKTEQALQGRLEAARGSATPAPAGGAVVLDPSNGQVRAMASFPTYNPADLVGGIPCPVWRDLQGLAAEGSCKDVNGEIESMPSSQRPTSKLINRALQGSYPPASTFKLATAYAALKLGVITPADTISDGGSYRLCDGNGPGCLKKNAGSTPHGSVDLSKAMSVSSDVYFYRIGDLTWSSETIPEDGLQTGMKELGYGSRTGIDLPAEAAGLIPTPKSEAQAAENLYKADPAYYDNDPEKAKDAGRWRTGFSADLAIGQKVSATPLQTANAYASLANGGTLYRPQVLDHVTKTRQPDQVVRAFEAETIRTIDWGDAREALIQGFTGAVNSGVAGNRGTAYSTFEGFPLDSFPLAGKTGTAQTGKDENDNEKPENSLFVGFSLLPNSQWVASAMLEGAGAGANAAAPAVRLILEPIATGELATFEIPIGGAIDAAEVAASTSDIGTAGGD